MKQTKTAAWSDVHETSSQKRAAASEATRGEQLKLALGCLSLRLREGEVAPLTDLKNPSSGNRSTLIQRLYNHFWQANTYKLRSEHSCGRHVLNTFTALFCM